MAKEEIPKGFAVEGSDFEQRLHDAGEPIFHAATLKERALAFYKDMGIDPPADLLAEEDHADEWDDGGFGSVIQNALSSVGINPQAPTPPPLPAPTVIPTTVIADVDDTKEEETQ